MTKPSAGTSGEPSSAPTGTNAAARFRWTAAWALVAIVALTHVLGAGPFATTLWGANVYAFLPRWALPIALALLAVSLIAAGRSSAPLDRALGSLPAPATRLRMALLMAASFAAFWIFREGHTLLGDGSPLTRSIPLGQRFHPYQPLTVLAHHGFYSLVHGLFASPGQDPREIARNTVALSSALAGALFMPTAWALANEIARAVTPDPAPPAAGAVAVAPWIFLVLLVQGYVQLFFGYVENYTFSALVSSVYLLASLRYLRGASPLALAGMALVLDVGLDLSSVILVPSFVVLVVVGLMRRGGWPGVLRDLAIAGLLGAAITLLMGSVQPGYHLASTVWAVVLQALLGHGDRAQSLAYMFSGAHLRDFLNEQLLIGPAAAYLLIAGLAGAIVARTRPPASALFLLVAGLASLAGAWAATDLGLGYPRDWDLFAPSGIVFTAAGLALALSGPWRGNGSQRWLWVLACVSLFHTVPWITINTSFERSFERFKTLPLGLGRTESAVGAVYLARGDTLSAIPWFQRSLDAYPANNVAAFRLGQIGMRRGMYPQAVRAFSIAVRSRPDRENYRFALVDAIVRSGEPPDAARAHLDTLLMQHPGDPTFWTGLGVVSLGLGDREHARSAFERARQLAPGDSALFDRLRRHLGEADGYVRAVREDWSSIAGDD